MIVWVNEWLVLKEKGRKNWWNYSYWKVSRGDLMTFGKFSEIGCPLLECDERDEMNPVFYAAFWLL